MNDDERRQRAFREAGRVLAEATRILNQMTPDEAAEAAWTPGGPSKQELISMAKDRQRRREA